MKEVERTYRRRKIVLGVLLLGLGLGSVMLGRYPMTLREILGILSSKFLHIEPFWSSTQASLLLNHRLPRVFLAMLVGGGLSAAGATYQCVFRNPMASPDLLGASGGAAFGASLAILLNGGSSMIITFAFMGSLLTVLLVMALGSMVKGNRTIGLVLAGIMIGSLVSSGISLIKLVADPGNQLPAITYWLMGSLNRTHAGTVKLALVPIVIGLVPLYLLRWRIGILAIGEEEASTLGIRVTLLRTIVILASPLITAGAVAVSGVIGWIGLVIPHLARKITGGHYANLLGTSVLLGAIFLLGVDDFARTVWISELPLGILTSFLGAPFFLWLMRKGGRYGS